MDTIKIKAILTAIKHNSLSKAAEEFSYTPSAFSHMADSLEEELGLKILIRTPQGVRLSEDGEALYSKLKGVVKAEEELKEYAKSLSEKKQKNLKIAAYSSVSENLLPEILSEFKKQNANINFSITVGDGIRIFLEKGEVDVIFAEESISRDFLFTPIMEDEYLAVAQAGSFSQRKSVRVEELYSFNFINLGEKTVEETIDAEKFISQVKIQSPENSSVLSMVRNGLGVAFLPSLSLKNKPQGVQALKTTPKITRTIGFAYKEGLKSTAIGGEFIEFLEKKFSLRIIKNNKI